MHLLLDWYVALVRSIKLEPPSYLIERSAYLSRCSEPTPDHARAFSTNLRYLRVGAKPSLHCLASVSPSTAPPPRARCHHKLTALNSMKFCLICVDPSSRHAATLLSCQRLHFILAKDLDHLIWPCLFITPSPSPYLAAVLRFHSTTAKSDPCL